MMRTLARRVRDEPTRSNSPVSSTRSSLACRPIEMLAISSRNSVPPSASSKRPTRSVLASVKAPFTWPNSSLSNTPFGQAAGVDGDQRRAARATRPRAATARRVPLPVPFSPVMRTLASDGPTRATMSSTGRIAADSAISVGRFVPWSRQDAGSRPRAAGCGAARGRAPPACARRPAARSLSHGFWMKSRAPRRIASTARSTVPHAVITTTGIGVSSCCSRDSSVRPSSPEVVSRA